MDILTINAFNLIHDAYNAMPAFTDADGQFVSGIYGALFKLKSIVRSGEHKRLGVLFDSDGRGKEPSPAVASQTARLKEILETYTDSALLGADGCECNDALADFLEKEIAQVSPLGKAAAAPVFEVKTGMTSDLSEVEDLFNKAAKVSTDSYVGFYPIIDTVDTNGSIKKKDIIGISLCFEDETSVYIPIQGFITSDYLGGKLAELSKNCNLATFDIKSSYNLFTPYEIEKRDYGYTEDDTYSKEPRCFDTLIGAYLNDPNKNDYMIEDISKEYLGINFEKRADLFGKELLSNADSNVLSAYASKAAFICRKAAPLIRKKLEKGGMEALFYNIEMPLSYILFSMEKEGIIAKREQLKIYGDELKVRIDELEKSIYDAAGVTFNINSPKQLGEVLFEKLGLPAEKKTKSGYSTAADVLEKLAGEHKIVSDILEYRGLAKLKSTYADGLAAFIEDDDRIHTSFNQTITATGRISSTEPNLQNIPMRTELGRLIRKVFVPKEGYVFADADYSQIELRILAHMSGDEGLIKAYHDGEDIHASTASKVFHVPFSEVTSEQRRSAKAVNFGIVYGISAYGLSRDLSISPKEAKEYMDKYFEAYPRVKEYQERVVKEAKDSGGSITLFGRKRPIPELRASNFNIKQFGERVAMNAPIQGTAADIMKIAMINVFFRLKKDNLKSKLILQIHDELVIETARDETDIVKELLTKEMESAVTLVVPMEATCHTGNDWYEAK
ncbi:DNA polymerase I [Butyrivibrio sp. INlla21]|uniref:DNA polymerase I n=1 Tax=Butyrivibrio sp. INlla21 TaxID=1520811 RepID=UPI0008F17BB4|nr:DNA polymerase I [Butyrivibrio sp. INlla21]SFU47351.1 DNA polymerase I [Butyrivibrio sp. INlla21]